MIRTHVFQSRIYIIYRVYMYVKVYIDVDRIDGEVL